MAPSPEAYLPSLDKCFSGDAQLLSWKGAFLYACRPEDVVDDTGKLHAFLSRPESVQLLSNCLSPFHPPSAKSKTDFESKTAAIHTETSAQASYNLKEIKEDALWLSQKAGIDEISALRIAILEWQNRPATRLLSGFAEEETSSLQGATGAENFRVSLAGPSFAEILNPNAGVKNDASPFESTENRRLRLRNVYLLERGHIVKTARKLLALLLNSKTNGKITEQGQDERNTQLCELAETVFENKLAGEGWRTFVQACIKATRDRLTALEGDGGWLGLAESNEATEDMWRTTLVEETLHILQILFLQLQASTEIPVGELQLSWLQLMRDYSFLEPLQVPCKNPVEVLLPLQGFVCLTTLAFLKLPLTVQSIINKAPANEPKHPPYFLSKEEIGKINAIFVNEGLVSQVANPATFSWGLILHTMRELALTDKESRELEQFHSAIDSFQSNTPHAGEGASDTSLYEELLDCVRTPKLNTDESIDLLTSETVKNSAIDAIIALATRLGSTSAVDDAFTNQWTRAALLDLIRTVMIYMDYSPEVVESVLAILSGPSAESSWLPNTLPAQPSDPRSIFRQDDVLMNNIFRVARSRFPYEMVPFLRLCRALISKDLVNEEDLPDLINELESMETFTQMVPAAFQGYETIREDENANLVTLVQSLPMIGSAAQYEIPDQQPSNALVVTGSSQVPAATIGQVVSESKPAVVMWQHQYSCLSYLGSWLEQWNESGGSLTEGGEDASAEAIGLLADLLVATRETQRDNDSGAKRILELASDGLARQSDIISVIFEIFERNLSSMSTKSGSDSVLESTIACLRFMCALITVLPGRVWPLLCRSDLLGSDGKGGIMTVIVSGLEVTSGDYPFLLACIRLFEAVVDDAASRAILRKSPNTGGKIMAVSDWTSGVPSHMMRGALLNFVRPMVEVYNSSINWRFNKPEQRFELNATLAKTFERIVYFVYGANDTTKLDAKATGIFSSSATYLLDVLRPRSAADLPFNPILRLIVDGLQTPPTLYLRYLTLVESQVVTTLELSTRLLQAAQLAESPPSLLEEQLFKATPVLIKLYALHDAYRRPVISLLVTLVSGAALDPANEPPSLVGHLGAESSCLFLDVLSQFDKPLSDRSLQLAVWQMLSTLVSKRQQWLAVYILTGSSPRQTLKKTFGSQKAPAMRGAPFLKVALDMLSNIEQLEPQVSLALLEFVSQAQENWPWATFELKKHSQFFNSIVHYVSKLNISSLPVGEQIFATQIAAVVADLFAVYLHSAKEMRDRSFYKTLIPLVSWYAKGAVDVSRYNASLHANLRRNFEMRYPGCKLADFKRTQLQPRSLGKEYCYDIHLGEKLLSYDFAWAGTRNQGFAQEFERANLNLSLVEAQVRLLHSWKFFATEHCVDFMVDREIQKSMAVVARSCLEANTAAPQEAIFERVQQTRVDFAQVLVQRLVESGAKGSEVFSLLAVVWDALRSRRATYEEALIHDDTEYYRSLLNVLFLALQFHHDLPSRPVPETLSKKAEISSDLGLVVEVVKTVVAQGFKSLTTYLHEQPDKCTPKDFAILTAILQSCLQVKNVDRLFEHVVYHIADNDIARHATALFSWADQLAVAGDPVYGDLSISFLVKLSTIPMLAEHLAVEAILARLSTCRLTNLLRQPQGFGPLDPVPRIYSIWTNGLLPLCLNLLFHVIRTAPEVAAFLNQFEGQLTRASESFSAGRKAISTSTTTRHKITSGMASEAYSLALISFILGRFREAGPSVGVDADAIQDLRWDKAQVKEDIEELLERRSSLRARIVATSDKEVELMRQKPADAASGAENRLEEKIVNELKSALVCLGGEEAS